MSMDAYPSDWEQRRYNVLRRDKFKCQACGMYDETAVEKFGRGLHAHHMTPISEGGEHDLENLVALCERCHYRVHSNQDEVPYEPRYIYHCDTCGNKYFEGDGYATEYCCSACWARARAKGALNQIHSDKSICSTCFSRTDSDSDTCPNCGNWELNEVRRDNMEVDDLDIEYLLMHILKSEQDREHHKD